MNKKSVLLVGGGILFIGLLFFLFKKDNDNFIIKENTLLIGTEDNFPPFCFSQDGAIVGFDIDVARAVAGKLGKDVKIINMDFDVLLLELQNGSIDIIAAGLTSTPERKKKVFFTKPYFSGHLVMLQKKNAHKQPLQSVSNLKEKKVVVNAGYTADLYVSKQGIDPLRVTTVAEAMLALTSGQVDVFVTAESSLTTFFKKHSKEQFLMTELTETQENCALAVTPQKPELCEKVENAIYALKQEGILDQLKEKWEL